MEVCTPFLLGMAFCALVVDLRDAKGQAVCYSLDEIREKLWTKHKEEPLGIGVQQSGNALLQLFASKNGSWTIVQVNVRGCGQVMAHGTDWQHLGHEWRTQYGRRTDETNRGWLLTEAGV